MRSFMDRDFMLYNDTGARLYHTYAEKQPIVDYHCHIPPQEIFEDRRYRNIAEVWFGGRGEDGKYFGDHYKWRLMRANGTPEEVVTGSADPYEKLVAFTKTLEMAIGNPMYHWSNLELHQYFGITEPLTMKNVKEVWDKTSDMLQHDANLSVRGIIRQSNVEYVGTTDDPADDLRWHEKLAEEKDLGFKVCPSFRPDKAVNIQRDGFAGYIGVLSQAVGYPIQSAEDVCRALCDRVDYFKKHGCRASDHGLDYVPFNDMGMDEANRVFAKAMAGEKLTKPEIDAYQTALLLSLAKKYHQENIVMEIHYSCTRNNNKRMFELEGPDTGYDMIAKSFCFNEMAQLFSKLDETNELPKTVVFSLDEADFNQVGSLLGCFQSDEIPGKMQLGVPWWFLDTRDGMEHQMKAFANVGLLGNFIGMLTDSRSFLSYPRHDYFRRIICNVLGEWVEKGEYPDDEESLKKIVEGICCKNAERYFGL